MTTNTITTPTASKGRETRRKTIFSIMGITLLVTCLLIGIVHGAVNDNSPVSEDKIHSHPGEFIHFVLCHSETEYLGYVTTDEWFYIRDDPEDLQACVAQYGPSVRHSEVVLIDRLTD